MILRILIKGGRIIDPSSHTDKVSDLLIEEGFIKAIDYNIECNADSVIDASGLWIIPGLVDMHCHLREPGYESKETIYTGTRSAAAGGFTSVACMPNTQPPIDSKLMVEYIRLKAEKEAAVKVYPIGCITKGREGKELATFGMLKEAGAVALSDDGDSVANSRIMRLALQYALSFDMPVIAHCEDKGLAADGIINDGAVATCLGLKGIPAAAEEVIVARDIVLAASTGGRLHIAHVSTAGSVEMIRQAKRLGINVTCETCPHYFSLTDEMAEGYNTAAKVNPPLRSPSDVEAIISGLKDGTIDVIATDHAPHDLSSKGDDIYNAAFGISGFETALSVGITYLVDTDILEPMQFIAKMTHVPADILGINAGQLSIGLPADVAIVDPYAEYTVDTAKFISKGKNSPYDGMRLKGRVLYTIADGRYVLYGGQIAKGDGNDNR